jgi:hypothetical protein
MKPSVDHALLGELLALRTIRSAICRGEPMTAETMRRLINRADQNKLQQANKPTGISRSRQSVWRHVGDRGDARKEDQWRERLNWR